MKAIEYLNELKADCLNSDNRMIADYCSSVFEVVYTAYFAIKILDKNDLVMVEQYRTEMIEHSESLSRLSD